MFAVSYEPIIARITIALSLVTSLSCLLFLCSTICSLATCFSSFAYDGRYKLLIILTLPTLAVTLCSLMLVFEDTFTSTAPAFGAF